MRRYRFMRQVKYTHPAATKYEANKNYNLEELQSELSMEMIQALFEPIDFEWSDLNDTESIYNKEEIASVEEIDEK